MITSFSASYFGCLRRTSLGLTPLHALIGPNDSGKSTLLRALRLWAELGRDDLKDVPPAHLEELVAAPPGVLEPALHGSFEVSSHDDGASQGEEGSCDYTIRINAEHRLEEEVKGRFTLRGYDVKHERQVGRSALHTKRAENAQRSLPDVLLLRLDPDALRAPSALIPEGHPVHFLSERGAGLPGVYDAIINRGDDSFQKIAADVRRLFPGIRSLRLRTPTSGTKALEVELADRTRVPAGRMSEGLLYYLAFAALPYLGQSDARLLLVEEPENGLHPSRIADVMRLLRALIEQGTQVLLTTHSPLVINEMKPDEVTLVTRGADGTRLTPMARTRNFAERAQVYALGELWLSYANGVDEDELVTPQPDLPFAPAAPGQDAEDP